MKVFKWATAHQMTRENVFSLQLNLIGSGAYQVVYPVGFLGAFPSQSPAPSDKIKNVWSSTSARLPVFWLTN
jgi:hypothetical protein